LSRDIEEKKAFTSQLELRTKDFSVKVIKTLRFLKQGDEGRIIKNQIFRSATSIGANYREANRARSKADFKNKIRISLAETNETVYWLEIIDDLDWLEQNVLNELMREAREFLAIFSSITKNLKD
jgi:four helix bundle protein